MSGVALAFGTEHMDFREQNSLADQVKCGCVSCPSRIRVSLF